MSQNRAAARVAQRAAEQQMNETKPAEQKPSDQPKVEKPQTEEQLLVNDTERLALIEENERLTRELDALKKKHVQPAREANRYENGTEIPEGYGVYAVTLRSSEKGPTGRNEILSTGEIVACDEGDALRQAMNELCDKKGWQQPPSWLIREVEATAATLQAREDRLRFGQWRTANRKRESRGEDLLPLPPSLKKFEDKQTDIERLATA